MPSDTSEKGLESLIFAEMVARGWLPGDAQGYSPDYALDLAQLVAFVRTTQPNIADALDIDSDNPTRRSFLGRLQGEITKRGMIDVLRNGLKHGPHSVDVFYGTPSPDNAKAVALHAANRFSITRQIHYSRDAAMRSLDLCLFINGLPIATFELKNSLTKQTIADAIEQYKRDRDPRELIFKPGRCAVHFAVDDKAVSMCASLAGDASWFLPFNQGYDDGSGNPPNPDGLMTDFLWKRILTPASLTNILENYAQQVQETNPKTGKKKDEPVFPRYHQLDVVRKLLAHAAAHGAGQRYLIQHSAGSGKSKSIAWLAHQLIGLRKDGTDMFDSVIVITDRRILDDQITNTIRQFTQIRSTVGHSEDSTELRKYIESGKKIITTTVQKFPVILDDIGTAHRGRHFAIIIDEAHSSQGGRATASMSMALAQAGAAEDDETLEDAVNRIMESKKILPNASYFAFTATPKNKTLEIFGEPFDDGGTIKRRPFHTYTMKQAIQEGFILDVLRSYTPVKSYYRLVKTVDSDPEFDTKRAQKKLRHFVETNSHAIKLKAEIMVDHFLHQVIALRKIGGNARAMVVTSGIELAIQYYHAIRDYLIELNSPYQAIVAFSGEHEYGGAKVTEASLNGFPSNVIADRIKEDPYRFLVCADKFQTGFDEPLLHSMYVDKALSGIKAVQTLSRLNRAHPQKYDVFVLDFVNDTESIEASFAAYYRTTILSAETDPNKLHDLKNDLDNYQVYTPEQVDALVAHYLKGAPRDRLDPILDSCVTIYNEALDETGQVEFKSKAKAFTRTYSFLSSILTWTDAEWEKLSIFLNFLIPKLPAPKEEDLSVGILETIDMDSYRVEKQAAMAIVLADENGVIGPIPVERVGGKPEPELDHLSNIVNSFNEMWGNITWTDQDRILRLIAQDIPAKVSADKAYTNARANSDKQNARIEHDKALDRVMNSILNDDTELYKRFMETDGFRKWLRDKVFEMTYQQRV